MADRDVPDVRFGDVRGLWMQGVEQRKSWLNISTKTWSLACRLSFGSIARHPPRSLCFHCTAIRRILQVTNHWAQSDRIGRKNIRVVSSADIRDESAVAANSARHGPWGMIWRALLAAIGGVPGVFTQTVPVCSDYYAVCLLLVKVRQGERCGKPQALRREAGV